MKLEMLGWRLDELCIRSSSGRSLPGLARWNAYGENRRPHYTISYMGVRINGWHYLEVCETGLYQYRQGAWEGEAPH
jgi:hypothetical protein